MSSYSEIKYSRTYAPRSSLWRNMKYDLAFREKFFQRTLSLQSTWTSHKYLRFFRKLSVFQSRFFTFFPSTLLGLFNEMSQIYNVDRLPIFRNVGTRYLETFSYGPKPDLPKTRYPYHYIWLPKKALRAKYPSRERFQAWKKSRLEKYKYYAEQ